MTNGADRMTGQGAAQRVSYYFSAHQDDWQLFMNPSAFRDVLDDNAKCVFIHMTAGDAGLGTGRGGRKHPLYLAREHGAESAIRFMADSDNRLPVEAVASTMAFNGHPIRRVSYRNTVAYFLRVPDGSPAGTGYADTGHQSLQRLAGGQIGTLSVIDDTTAYHGWKDLVTTLRSVIDFERGRVASLQFHVPEADPVFNPNDHSDHYMTAKAARDAAEGLTGVRRVHYVGYAGAERPENLSGQDRDMKCAVYAVTLAGMLALDHPAAWQHYDHSFVGRNYCRVEDDSGASGESDGRKGNWVAGVNQTAAASGTARWEHFPHEADVGVRGFGATAAQAFEQGAQALTAVVTRSEVAPKIQAEVSCEAPDLELLFVEWLNAIIYEMAVRGMLFSRFAVRIDGTRLTGTLWGEPVDVERHAPACEPKGATYTALKVAADNDGVWSAACVVDV